MTEYQLIKKALSSFLVDSTGSLARILCTAAKTGQISFEEIEKLIEPEDDIEEVLLLGYDYRILIPARSFKSMEWTDRVLMAMRGEIYQMPNVIQNLVGEAGHTGKWEPKKAVVAVFKQMEEPEWAQMPKLVEMLTEQARGRKITATQIKQACKTLGLGDRVDSLIAELKGSGIMSPTLGYLPEAAQKRSPTYELNASIFSG